MKSLILAAGRGERLELNENKCMLLINGKPLIQNALEYSINAMVDEIIIVVGYKAEEIVNYFGTKFEKIPIKYVFQHDRKGIVHAIECAKDFLNDDFLLLLGDEIISNSKHKEMRQYFDNSKLSVLCGVVQCKNEDQIRKNYSILTIDKAIYRLVEKPSYVFNHWIGTGSCFFRKHVLNYIDLVPINMRRGREEKELVDLIQCAIDNGERVEWFEVGNEYENINDKQSLLSILKNKNMIS